MGNWRKEGLLWRESEDLNKVLYTTATEILQFIYKN